MKKPTVWLPTLAAMATLALATSAARAQSIDFAADNANVPSPHDLGPKAESYAYKDAYDAYSDDPNLNFRKPQPTFSAALTTVPTFQSIGIYWAPPNAVVDRRARVQFRKHGDEAWQDGLPLWFDPRNREYRGSLVMLDADTTYDIALQLADEPGTTASTTQATWTDHPVVARTIIVPETSSTTLQVNISGKEGAYVRYEGAPGTRSVINMGTALNPDAGSCVKITASFVIVSNLTLQNCQRQGIEIAEKTTNVIIEGNDISGFGAAPSGTEPPPTDGGTPTNKIVPGTEYEAGIYCQNVKTAPNDKARRIVIQRNTIHHPRYGSQHWAYGHPNSAQAVMFSHCGSNHVIRYNTIYSAPGHYFNDGIGGLSNFSFEGFPNTDSDINGNDISGVYDDAIESEGANRNVRIWGNYLHHVYNGVGMATVSEGPIYAFRNILSDTVGMHAPNTDPESDDHGSFFKLGSDQPIVNGGRIYIFHNTNLQPPPFIDSHLTTGMGAGGFLTKPSNYSTCNIVSRNNLMINRLYWRSVVDVNENCGKNDIDYDAFIGAVSDAAFERHRAVGSDATSNAKPIVFKAGNKVMPTFQRWTDTTNYTPAATLVSGTVFLTIGEPQNKGDFSLDKTSLGYGTGVYLPNFNTAATPGPGDTGIDAGAHQRDTAPMEFGAHAYEPKP